MPDTKIIIADQYNPWFNLATEHWLINHPQFQDTQILYLWRNSPCIVIGRYQNPWVECNLKAMQQDDILLARRFSGGGAVYQDLGNTCFTFISPKDQYDKEHNFDIVTQALAACNIQSELSGRNDILVGGRKVSGSAFQVTSTRGCHHGTLLINANLTHIADYLTPDAKKLASKGVRSVASRVVNLQEIEPSFTNERFSKSIIEAFNDRYGQDAPILHLQTGTLQQEHVLMDTYQQLAEDTWRYGKTPQFTHSCEQRLPWGNINFQLNVQGGVITHTQIYSDTLNTRCIEVLQEILKDNRYDINCIQEKAKDLVMSVPQETAEQIRQALQVLQADMV